MLAHFILSLLYFEWCKLIRWLLVPAASHGCQNMTKEPVLVIFWSNLCNQYRGLPRQILLFIWSKNMFFRLVSASLGQIWTFLRRVFRSPVNVALKEGCPTPSDHHTDTILATLPPAHKPQEFFIIMQIPDLMKVAQKWENKTWSKSWIQLKQFRKSPPPPPPSSSSTSSSSWSPASWW